MPQWYVFVKARPEGESNSIPYTVNGPGMKTEEDVRKQFESMSEMGESSGSMKLEIERIEKVG